MYIIELMTVCRNKMNCLRALVTYDTNLCTSMSIRIIVVKKEFTEVVQRESARLCFCPVALDMTLI